MHVAHRLLKFISLRMKLGVKMEYYMIFCVQMIFDLSGVHNKKKQDYKFSSPVFLHKESNALYVAFDFLYGLLSIEFGKKSMI